MPRFPLSVLALPIGIEPHQQTLVGVLLGVIVLRISEAVPIPIGGLLGVAGIVFLGVAPVDDVLSPFGSSRIFTFIGTFILAQAMLKHDRRDPDDGTGAEVIASARAVLDVVVGSNLFGDILSDLAAAVVGSIGIAPSANLDPTKQHPSMFEPVHGSAPDIAGKGVANPAGAVWSAAMMLEHLGHAAAAADVIAAMEATLAKPETRTADLGGTASTSQVTEALLSLLGGHKPHHLP